MVYSAGGLYPVKLLPVRVVVLPPSLNQILCLLQRVEDFCIQKFISEFAIEDFVVSILPWAAGLHELCLHADWPEPGSDGNGRKLQAIVRADMIRRAIPDKQVYQAMKDMVGLELAPDDDSQEPSGELIDHRLHAVAPAVIGSVLDEVIAPDMIGPTKPNLMYDPSLSHNQPRLNCSW